MLKVDCDSCGATHQIDERRIPPKGLKMLCPKCRTTLLVMRPGTEAAEVLPAAPPPAAAERDLPAAKPPGPPPRPGAPPRPPPRPVAAPHGLAGVGAGPAPAPAPPRRPPPPKGRSTA